MATPADKKERLIFSAKLAEHAERYDDMAKYMKQTVELADGPLSTEERNLLSVAYKNAVGSRRGCLRILSCAEDRHRKKNNSMQADVAKEYCTVISAESQAICQEVLNVLAAHLLKSKEPSPEGDVFYEKMQGDYNRYACEFATGAEREKVVKDALKHYQQAREAAEALSPLNPVRLGLALNFSVFYYEILDDKEEACKMAQKAFDMGVADIANEGERDMEEKKDSNLILQLLRDNLHLWLNEKEIATQAKAAAAPPADAAEAAPAPAPEQAPQP